MTWNDAYLHYEFLYGRTKAEQIIELALKTEVFRKMAEAEDEPVFRDDFRRMADSYREQLDDVLRS